LKKQMKSPNTKIHYFDYNATHPPIMELIAPIYAAYGEEFYNPSGISKFSLRNQRKIEESRNFFQSNDGYPLKGHIFSATGTEANHILVAALRLKYPDLDSVYTSSFEHASFYAALEFFGFHPILIQTDKSGLLDLNQLEEYMHRLPLPIGVVYAVNETGVIQPMEEISRIAHKYEMPLISDCMQAFGKIQIDYPLLDGYTCSGHKIGAGMGAGLTALNHRLIVETIPFIKGGNQEHGLRAGTENVPAIQSFAEVAKYQITNWGGIVFENLQIQLELKKYFPSLGIEIVAEKSPLLPNTLFLLLPCDDLDFFLIGMEERNTVVATGSSCKSRAREASTILLRMGYTKEEALRAIRISWGCKTSREDIEALKNNFREILNLL